MHESPNPPKALQRKKQKKELINVSVLGIYGSEERVCFHLESLTEISPNDIWKVILLSFIKPFKRISDYLFQFRVGIHLYT